MFGITAICHENQRLFDYGSLLNSDSGESAPFLGGGVSSQYFWNFHPDNWGLEMIQFDGSRIFFRWVGSTSTTN